MQVANCAAAAILELSINVDTLLPRDRHIAHRQSLKTIVHHATRRPATVSCRRGVCLRPSQDTHTEVVTSAHHSIHAVYTAHVDRSTLCVATNYLRALYRMSEQYNQHVSRDTDNVDRRRMVTNYTCSLIMRTQCTASLSLVKTGPR